MTTPARIKYVWRITGKVFLFFIFGIGSFIIVTAIFPTLFTFTIGSRKAAKRIGRKVICKAFTLLVDIMQWLRLITFTVKNKEQLTGLRGKVIVANHPSLIDVVMLISIIPNADCLVKGSLTENRIIRGIVNRLYIPNSENFDDILQESKLSMEQGNCFIIFPEGTRTRPGTPLVFKKGAARIALNAGCDVIPIYFGGNSKTGLGKNDRFLSFNPSERYRYNLEVLEPISTEKYRGHNISKAATLLTEEMRQAFVTAQERDPG